MVSAALPRRNMTKAASAGPRSDESIRYGFVADEDRISAVPGEGQVARIDPASEENVRTTGSAGGSVVAGADVVGAAPVGDGDNENADDDEGEGGDGDVEDDGDDWGGSEAGGAPGVTA